MKLIEEISKLSLILSMHMQQKMLTKVLIIGMALNINISMEVKQGYINNGTAKFLIILNMRFYVSCFLILDFGFNNIMLMVSGSMGSHLCYINIEVLGMVSQVNVFLLRKL